MRMLMWAALFCCGSSYSQPLTLPTDVDLKAAYCTPVYRSRLSLTPELDDPRWSPEALQIIKKHRERNQSDQRRTQLYLLPRLQYLASDSLMSASRGGEEDIAAASRTAAACKCETLECALKCPVGPETARLHTCDGAPFLPF